MKISIKYEASWRNSFLDGSNNEPLKKRNFIASSKKLNDLNQDNYISRDVSHNTVMGLLNRLIGDQRKLYQSREDKQYYFKTLEKKISFKDNIEVLSEEIVRLRNASGSSDPSAYSGVINDSHPMFSTKHASKVWDLLSYDLDQIISYILSGKTYRKKFSTDPFEIDERLVQLRSSIENKGNIKKALTLLSKKFKDVDYKLSSDTANQQTLYCSALYLKILELSEKYDMSAMFSKRGGLSGISKRGYTPKDFLSVLSKGKKRVYGSPFIQTRMIKGVGKVKNMLNKASGKLDITIDVDKEKAKELKAMIENAGVSSFYIGKKGLAYVDSIRI